MFRAERLLVTNVLLLYLILGVESYLGHWFLLRQGSVPAMLPILTSLAGIAGGLRYLLRPDGFGRVIFRRILLATLAVAVIGVIVHSGTDQPPAPLAYVLPALLGHLAISGHVGDCVARDLDGNHRSFPVIGK